MILAKKVITGVLTLSLFISSGLALKLYNEKDSLRQQLNQKNKTIEKLEELNKDKDKKIKNANIELKEKEKIIEEKGKVIEEKNQSINNLKKELYNSKVSYCPTDLRKKSGATADGLNQALKGTGLEGLGYSYIYAEKIYGVNAIFLVSLTAEESGWGTSRRARYDNNLSGYAVYTATSRGVNFRSKSESIMKTAKLIGNEYLKTNGKHYNGVSIYDVNKKYCTTGGTSWSSNINSIANKILKQLN